MRKTFFSAAAALAVAMGLGATLQEKPVNAKCPVKGEPAKANITVEVQGKVIGFC